MLSTLTICLYWITFSSANHGNEDFAQVFEAAASYVFLHANEDFVLVDPYFANATKPVVLECTQGGSTNSFVPFERLTPGGTLHEILTKRKVNILHISHTSQLQTTFSHIKVEQTIFDVISDFYGIGKIQINETAVFATTIPETKLLFDEINAGTYHMSSIVTILSGFSGTERLNVAFRSTCSFFAQDALFYTDYPNIKSYDELLEFGKENDGFYKIGVTSALVYNIAFNTQLSTYFRITVVDSSDVLNFDLSFAAHIITDIWFDFSLYLSNVFTKDSRFRYGPLFKREYPHFKVDSNTIIHQYQTGNSNLKAIIDASFVNYVYNRNLDSFLDYPTNGEFFFSCTTLVDCVINTAVYPTPLIEGTLKSIYDSGVLRIGIPRFAIVLAALAQSLIDEHNMIDFEKLDLSNIQTISTMFLLCEELSNTLGKTVVPEFLFYDNWDSLYEALEHGIIDMTSNLSDDSVYYQGQPGSRFFLNSCFYGTFELFYVFYAPKDPLMNTEEIFNLFRNNNDKKIAFLYQGHQASFESEFRKSGLENDTEFISASNVDFIVRFCKGLEPTFIAFVIKGHFGNSVEDSEQYLQAPNFHCNFVPTGFIAPLTNHFRQDRSFACGDGVVDPLFGEQCDEGKGSSSSVFVNHCNMKTCSCEDKCSTDSVNLHSHCELTCGNGKIDIEFGEECDGDELCDLNNCTCAYGSVFNAKTYSCEKSSFETGVLITIIVAFCVLLIFYLSVILYRKVRRKKQQENELNNDLFLAYQDSESKETEMSEVSPTFLQLLDVDEISHALINFYEKNAHYFFLPKKSKRFKQFVRRSKPELYSLLSPLFHQQSGYFTNTERIENYLKLKSSMKSFPFKVIVSSLNHFYTKFEEEKVCENGGSEELLGHKLKINRVHNNYTNLFVTPGKTAKGFFLLKNKHDFVVNFKFIYTSENNISQLSLSTDELKLEPKEEVKVKYNFFLRYTANVNVYIFVISSIPSCQLFLRPFSFSVFGKPSKFINPYRITIQSVIGKGMNSIIFKGLFDQSDVAIKEFCCMKDKKLNSKNHKHSKYSDFSNKSFAKFVKELSVFASLSHPNILTLFGLTYGPNLCIVMEFCPSGTMLDLIERKVKIPFSFKMRALLDIAVGANYLHSVGIIHRDIKPSNTLVFHFDPFSLSPCVKISDFGTARHFAVSNVHAYTGSIGTPLYVAPEIIKNEKYSHKADVYSFGITAWQILVETQPYLGMSAATLARYIVSGGRPPLSLKNIEKIPMCIPPFTQKMIAECFSIKLKKLLCVCWNPVSQDRPSFQEVADYTENMMFHITAQIQKDMEKTKELLRDCENLRKVSSQKYSEELQSNFNGERSFASEFLRKGEQKINSEEMDKSESNSGETEKDEKNEKDEEIKKRNMKPQIVSLCE